MKTVNLNLSLPKVENTTQSKLQRFNSAQFNRELKSSSREKVTPTPEVDVDIAIMNETPKEKAERLLKEANKRDIALMAASSRPTTRYAALYAASKNRGLDASLGRSLSSLETVKNKNLRMIRRSQETLKDDFMKTKKISVRQEKQFVKSRSESDIYEMKKKSFYRNGRKVKLPPIPLKKIDSL